MEIDDIREVVASGYSPIIKSILLSDTEYKLYRSIKKGGITSSELSKKQGISVQGANQKLMKLYEKGYLDRKSVPDPTGGFYFNFTRRKL